MPVNFTAIDFETANERLDSVCSLGMVRVENGIITDKRYRLIRPPDMRFSRRNIEVHGIYPSEVENEPQFYRYWNSIRSYLEPYPVVAHNANFDLNVLQAVLRRYALDNPTLTYTCSVKIARRTWRGLQSYGLNHLAKHFGHTFVHHHALEDAEVCAKIMLHACQDTQSDSVEMLSEKLKVSFGKISNGIHTSIKSNK